LDQQSLPSSAPKASLFQRLHDYSSSVKALLGKDIWELEYLGRKTLRARIFLLLRVISLTVQGLRRNKLPVQAAALTFYSLIGLGPLIAFGIMISGFLLEQDIQTPSGEQQNSIVVQKITQAIAYAAPQIAVQVDAETGEAASAQIDPKIIELISSFSEAAQSGTVGVVGSLMLLFIGIQVLTSIEGSFNSLWGVSQGRKLGERIVTYWTFISLGAVLGTAALSLLTANAIIQFAENLPFGSEIALLIQYLTPIAAFLIIVVLIAFFFRFIPNTKVGWKPALTGAVLVVVLLNLYNMLSFLYVQRVVDTRSLYGSVGIIVVLMLGLYVFWLLILFGGQVTYAVQNADFLTNENAWQKTSERSREVISLAILIEVAKRFRASEPAVRASELHKMLRVPSHILNSSINRLIEIGYINEIEGHTLEDERDHALQPSRPLEEIALGDFKANFECYGNNEGTDLVASTHSGIRTYLKEILSLTHPTQPSLKIKDLI
jgi:membrane protein